MDYAGWITTVCGLLEYQANITDATSATPTNVDAFNQILPAAIDYTENRIQRDLDLISTSQTATGVMLANSRFVTLPSINIPAVSQIPELLGTPVAPNSILTTTQGSLNVNVNWPAHGISQGEYISILTPVQVGGLTLGGVFNAVPIVDANNLTILAPTEATSTASAIVIGNGIFIVCIQVRLLNQPPLEPVTRDYLDYAWPSNTSLGTDILPVQWCPNDQSAIIVGPAPAVDTPFEVVGTMRVPQLSYVNYTTFLTQQLPDLYVAASMVFFSGYQRDFGAQAEDPKMAQSWEAQYQTLLAGAKVEEIRKSYANWWPSPSNPSGLMAG